MSNPTQSRTTDLPAFSDPARATQNLAQIRARVPAKVSDTIPPLLHDLPDPDGALNLLERFTESASEESISLLRKQPSLLHYMLTVFGYSQFLGETLIHNQDLLPTLLRDRALDRSHSPWEFRESFARFRSRSFDTNISQLLARFKRREYIRILLRDVLGLASLAETTAEISALADVLIDESLRECDAALRNRYGTPQFLDKEGKKVETPFAVLALGKLGGNELNYSSDIDLMFLYGDGDSPDDASITNREYFVRLAQQVTEVLSRITPEGFVFRTDLRLRPQGHEGEPAVSLSRAIHYYAEVAHDWECQAMIKVRHCAGDLALARQFIRTVQNHVYRPNVNFAAIETAIETRDRILDRRIAALTRESTIDVKLDRGGIRDIEFLVQCLQRVYGGREKWLRSGGTLFSLQKLHDKQHITGSDFHVLTTGYEFLRKVEHRLQLRLGQQTHKLPSSTESLRILARSLQLDPAILEESIGTRMAEVTEIYDRIIHHQQQQTEALANEEYTLRTLDQDFGRVHSDRQILQRLASDSPDLHVIASRDLDPHTRRNLFRFLSSACTSQDRYRIVSENAAALEKALTLFAESEFLTQILVSHPEDLVSLNDLRASSARHQAELFTLNNPVHSAPSARLLEYLSRDDVPQTDRLNLIRRRYRHQVFLSGAHDILESRPVFTSLSDTTVAAEESITSAFAIAGNPKGVAILALGRLGTNEFDSLSDADLIFLRDRDLPTEVANRAAETVVHALSSYTSEGTVMRVDLRIRPHGAEGELTLTPEQFVRYLASEAQPWEALAYTKLRMIAGDQTLGRATIASCEGLSDRFATSPDFIPAVLDMRTRLEKSDSSTNVRTAPGGLYDIDFIIGTLITLHRVHRVSGNTRDRLKKLGQSGLLNPADLQTLLDATELFRTTEHAIRLATGRSARELPVSEIARQSVASIVSRILGVEPVSLELKLTETRADVRQIFNGSMAR